MLYPSYYLFESSLPHRFTNNTTSSCISFYLLMHGWIFTSPVFVQSLSHVWLFLTPWTAALQAPLSSRSLLKFMSIESVMPSISSSVAPFSFCLQSCPALGSFPMSQLFTSGGQSIGASSSVPSNEYSGLISFKIDWFDLLAVQGILKHSFPHHNLKVSVLQYSAFFMVQLSHPYMTTGKTIVLTIQTFLGEVMPLLFNTLPSFVIPFLPRSKHLLISWLQSSSTVILEPEKIKSITASTFSPSIYH